MRINQASSILKRSKPLIGQLLIENRVITQNQLESALNHQKESGGPLGSVLLELDYIDHEASFLPILANQLKIEQINIKDQAISPDILSLIPAKIATHYKIVPINLHNNKLTIATNNPLDIQKLDEISMNIHYTLNPVLAGQQDIEDAIRSYYGLGADTIETMMDRSETITSNIEVDDIEDLGSEASISKFLNQILIEAYKDGATDIHIEPFEQELRVRYRIDGMLYDAKVPKDICHFKDAISSRIKVLSNLDITEKRLPQDGRFNVKVGDVDLDLRVSFLPTPCGDSVVLRILNSTRLYSLKELGLSKSERETLKQLTEKPNGIIFLTGPTGSGKTTTLYTCLSRMNTDTRKIITIEDPIEYQLNGITQLQINSQIGFTFAQGLRSMLRHDPDVMMVGEVRDAETATTAIQVALTGHLVFSTLHTNDAASGIARLLDMGIESYLITSTVQCFIAQRLVRKLCDHCKVPVIVSESMISELGDEIKFTPGNKIYEHAGCDLCHDTGYSGREAIYEFLILSQDLKKLILQKVTANEIKSKAIDSGMKTLRQSGWDKIQQGLTTLQEVIRVTQEGS